MPIIMAAMMLWSSALQFENNVRATKMTKKKKERPKAAYRAVIRNRGFKSCLSQREKPYFGQNQINACLLKWIEWGYPLP